MATIAEMSLPALPTSETLGNHGMYDCLSYHYGSLLVSV